MESGFYFQPSRAPARASVRKEARKPGPTGGAPLTQRNTPGGTREPAPLKGAFSKKSNYTKFLVLSLFAHILDARNDTKRQFCKRAISGRALIAVRAQARLFGKTPPLGC